MSTQSIPVLALTIKASGAIAKHRFVTTLCDQAVADENTLGVARHDAADGDLVTVDVLGTAIVEAGAAVSAGATVKSNADGKAIPWATSGAKIGIALQAAGASGDLIEVLLIPNAA